MLEFLRERGMIKWVERFHLTERIPLRRLLLSFGVLVVRFILSSRKCSPV